MKTVTCAELLSKRWWFAKSKWKSIWEFY